MLAVTILLLGLCTPQDICFELQKVRSFSDSRMDTCYEVVDVAHQFDLDPMLLVSVAWHESRFNNKAVSRAGARGALQVMPKIWCGSQACDYIYVGGRAYTKWRARAERKYRRNVELHTLAMYNGGNSPGVRSYNYAKKVLKTYKLLKRRLNNCVPPGC
jgi:hypothetical protein